MNNRIKIKEITRTGGNWGQLSSARFEYQHSNGDWQQVTREIYDHGSAAAMLLHDPQRDMVTLVRQFRLPPELSGDDGFLLEVCAGLLDGDDPETCARREAIEETGIEVKTIDSVFAVYPSPGSLTEKIHCFIGTYSGPPELSHAGLEEENEDIEILEMATSEALALIATGKIMDAKTILLLQHLALAER